MKNILLTILASLIFFIGAYYMGNYMFSSFNKSVPDQIIGAVYGFLCWGMIGMIILICYGIYYVICKLLKK